MIKDVRTAFRVILPAIERFTKPNKKLSVLKSEIKKLSEFPIWFLKFFYCRKDKPKSCSDILYQTPALNLISSTQGSSNGKN